MKRLILIYFFTLFIGSAFAQITQTVKGKITDKATGIGLPGVVVKIKGDATNQLGASSDGNGNYKITGVPIGRQTIIFTMIFENKLMIKQ